MLREHQTAGRDAGPPINAPGFPMIKPPPVPTRSTSPLYDHPRSAALQADQAELDPQAVLAKRHAKEARDLAAEHEADRKAILQGAAGPAVPAAKAIAETSSLQRKHQAAHTSMVARHERERADAKKAAHRR